MKLSPEILIGKSDFNETYFKKIDEIENSILDGKNFKDITLFSVNNIKQIGPINIKKFKKDGSNLIINEKLLKEIFKIQNLNSPSFISFENNFYIAEVLEEENSFLDINNKSVRETINNQIRIVNLIEENTSLIKKITDKKFGDNEMIEFSKKHNVPIEKTKISNINDNSKFNNVLLKQIYNYGLGQIFIVTDYPVAKKNFLIKINKEIEPTIKSESKMYKEYVNKANAQYVSKVYKSYDNYINAIYKININEKVLQRLINSI